MTVAISFIMLTSHNDLNLSPNQKINSETSLNQTILVIVSFYHQCIVAAEY